jgi:hypothetical protein
MRIHVIGFSFAALSVLSCSRPKGGSTPDSPVAIAGVKHDSVVRPIAPPPPPMTRRRDLSTALSRGARPIDPPSSSRPHLAGLAPDTGSLATGAVITVVVTGTGLTATGNKLFFGSIVIGDLPSDGKTLRFAVPQTAAPSSEVPPMAVQPGRYAVYIINANGVSDSLSFIVRGPEE